MHKAAMPPHQPNEALGDRKRLVLDNLPDELLMRVVSMVGAVAKLVNSIRGICALQFA
jgi:hypothetical protein